MDVNPPDVLKKSLIVPYKILMGAGPSNCSPEILQAISQPILGHLHKECIQIMDEIKEGIKYIFQTKNELTLALSASGHGGIETVLSNLLERNEKIVIAVNGFWGERVAELAERYGAVCIKMITETGNNFTLKQFENAIKQHKPAMLFVVMGDTSTGIYQPIEGLGKICHKYNCLLAVDTVGSLGAVPLFTDKWEIDAIYTGSQKVLGAPPGITPISFSERAKNKLFSRKTKPVFYFDMKLLGLYWGCFGNTTRIYHHTISSTLLCGLRTALHQFVAEGYESCVTRHQNCAKQLYKGLEDLGIKFLVSDERKRLPTVTTIIVPEYSDWKAISDYAMNKYLVEISGGLGPTANKVFRIGLMGSNATPNKVELTLKILKEAIEFTSNSKKSKL